STSIHSLLEMSITVPLTSFDNENLLPEVVDKRFRTCATRIDFEHPAYKHLFRILSEYFLVMAGWRAYDRHPGQIVDWKKLKLRFGHMSRSLQSSSIAKIRAGEPSTGLQNLTGAANS